MATPRKRGRPGNATTALVPAAARTPEPLSSVEATLNGEAIEVFARAVGGRDALAAVLSVAGVSPDIEKIATYLLDPRYTQVSLRRLCHYTGITVADLFAAYRKALIARSHIEATHIIASRLPPIVLDVMTRAAPQRMVCPACAGTSAAGQGPCSTCQSTGYVQSEPDLDRQKLALELGQLTEKKGGILVQQNNQVAATAFAATGTGALEQLHQAVGDLLFSPGRRRGGTPPEEIRSDPPTETRRYEEPDTLHEEEPPLPFPDDDGDRPAGDPFEPPTPGGA